MRSIPTQLHLKKMRGIQAYAQYPSRRHIIQLGVIITRCGLRGVGWQSIRHFVGQGGNGSVVTGNTQQTDAMRRRVIVGSIHDQLEDERQRGSEEKMKNQSTTATTATAGTAHASPKRLLSFSHSDDSQEEMKFCRFEDGVVYHPTRDALFSCYCQRSTTTEKASECTAQSRKDEAFGEGRKCFVAKDYMRQSTLLGESINERRDDRVEGMEVRVVKKYTAFRSHGEFYQCLVNGYDNGYPLPLYELLLDYQPRALYFDLDGPVQMTDKHGMIVDTLTSLISWVLLPPGETEAAIKPIVHISESPKKYSAHVVYPQLQFADHNHQNAVVALLLKALDRLEDNPVLLYQPATADNKMFGKTLFSDLREVVDRRPYSKFQAFRAPFACKLRVSATPAVSSSNYATSDQNPVFLPLPGQELYELDPLYGFASYVEPSLSVLPPHRLSRDSIIERHPFLRDSIYRPVPNRQAAVRWRAVGEEHLGFNADVFRKEFICKSEEAYQDGGALTDWLRGWLLHEEVDIYEKLMPCLNEKRCDDFSSWFRLCGITYSMLRKYKADTSAQRRIWTAFFRWSAGYKNFNQTENIQAVLTCRGKRVCGLKSLIAMVDHDRPQLQLAIIEDRC
eukprot:GHVQ01027568.1.p1 GENE.GHVQ01027568.1~~GHVQ01027568.1.p1  ORF type:complete len:620 (-),score=74.23 GHVQ01027568.1:461-2320(-)